jgi:hypothetical protein
MSLSEVSKESLWIEYCILCIRAGRIPDKKHFESIIMGELTYGDNLSLLIRSVKALDANHNGHSRHWFFLGVTLLTPTLFLMLFSPRTAPQASGPVSAMEAFKVAAMEASKMFEDSCLVGLSSGGTKLSADSGRCTIDGKCLYWDWRFYSHREGKVIRVITSGKTILSLDVTNYTGFSPDFVFIDIWEVDSTQAVEIVAKFVENLWRGDGLVPAMLELARSRKNEANLWFVTLLPTEAVKDRRELIVVVTADSGKVLYMIEM